MSVIKERRVSWTPSAAADVVAYRVRWPLQAGDDPTYADPYVEVTGTELLIPSGAPAFPLEEATRVIGVSAVDDVSNESDIALSPPIPFDFAVPDAPTDVTVD